MIDAAPMPPHRGPTERRILDFAENAFLGVPREVVKVSDIAAAAGVSVGVVYLHFGSKAGLYAAVREDIQLELTEFTMEPVTRSADPTWARLVENSIKWEQAFTADLPRVRLMAALDFTEGADEHVVAVNERIGARVRAALATAADGIAVLVDRGELRPAEPLPTAIWIYGTVLGTAIPLLQLPPAVVTREVIADAFAQQRRMLAQALLPPDRLHDDGSAPERYWTAPPPRPR